MSIVSGYWVFCRHREVHMTLKKTEMSDLGILVLLLSLKLPIHECNN